MAHLGLKALGAITLALRARSGGPFCTSAMTRPQCTSPVSSSPTSSFRTPFQPRRGVWVALLATLALSTSASADVNFGSFTTVDWQKNLDEPSEHGTYAELAYVANGDELDIVPFNSGSGLTNNYAALVSPTDAITGPGQVFEMSVVLTDPNSDDDHWGLTFGLQPGDDVATITGPPINNAADWMYWSWKATLQGVDNPGALSDYTSAGTTPVGMSAARVTGLISLEEFMRRYDDGATPGTHSILSTATAPANGDYRALPQVCTRTRYSTAGMTVWVNGTKVLDYTSGSALPTGRWGLVFAAQANISLRAGTGLCHGDNDADGIDDITDLDDDNDGILDSVEVGSATGDANSNGIPDFADPAASGFVDSNSDGVDDRYDADLDGLANHFDVDSDGDGVFDVIEANDADRNGLNDNTAIQDGNADGVVDGFTDGNTNGVDDDIDASAPALPDWDSDSTVDYLDPYDNRAPVITSSASFNAPEAQTSIATLTSTDPESDARDFSLNGGADASHFSISAGGTLTFQSAKNYASPDDTGTDGTYNFNVQVCETGTAETLCDAVAVSVTLTEANDPPTITSAASFNAQENQTSVTTLTATDPQTDTLVFSLTGSGADSAKFALTTGGVLSLQAAGNYEAPNDANADGDYQVQVQVCETATAHLYCASQDLTVTLTNANEAPSITSSASASGDENQTAVTTLTASDPETDTLAFSLTGSGSDDGAFSLSTAGVLSWSSAKNFEAPDDVGANRVYNIQVQACESATSDLFCDTQNLAVTLNNVNEAPSITSSALVGAAENQTSVASLTANDPETDSLSFSLVGGGADNALVNLSSGGTLSFIAAKNYEGPDDGNTDGDYEVSVQVCETGTSDLFCATQSVLVSLTSADESPVITSNGAGPSASIPIDLDALISASLVVTDVDATDPDVGDTLTFSKAGGVDAALFSVGSSSGVLSFISEPGLGNYDVTVEVCSDDSAPCDQQAITVAVGTNNIAPVITSNGGGSAASPNHDEDIRAVTAVTATDANGGDTLTYLISGGTDSAQFNIDSVTGALEFVALPDFETPTDAGTNNTYVVEVSACDDGTPQFCDSQLLTISLLNVNEEPTLTSNGATATATIAVEVDDLVAASLLVTTGAATDPDAGTTLAFNLSGGADVALFTIDSVSGELSFLSQPVAASYEVALRVCDDAGSPLCDIQTLTVVVGSDNVSPVITSHGGGPTASVGATENGTEVGTIVATDADASATISYRLSGSGVDEALFTIGAGSGVLSLTAPQDFENPGDADTNGIYELIVQACDDGVPVLCDSQTLSIALVNENEAPIITSAGGANNRGLAHPEGTIEVERITAEDPDANTVLDFAVVGPDAHLLDITDDGMLFFKEAPDYEAPADDGGDFSFNFTVAVCDQGPACAEVDYILGLTNVNEVPIFQPDGLETLRLVAVAGGQDAGSVLAVDPEGAEVNYRVVSGQDGEAIYLGATGKLRFNTAPMFDPPGDSNGDNIYRVVVEGCDPEDACSTQTVEVQVTEASSDTDGDGIPDGVDPFPADGERCGDANDDGCDDCGPDDGLDLDGDGICDMSDADSDGDGVPNEQDALPQDSSGCGDSDTDGCDDCSLGAADASNDGPDTDGDGICDATDPDLDNDGILNADDVAPLDARRCLDLDEDGCDDCRLTGPDSSGGDPNADGSESGDSCGVEDVLEADADADGVPDAEDFDRDGDGVSNALEKAGDADGDGLPNHLDLDSDNDGILDVVEYGLGALDQDGDGRLDDMTDVDGDGVAADVDANDEDPNVARSNAPARDSDGDGLSDARDLDSDGDGVGDLRESGASAWDEDGDGRLDGDVDDDGVAGVRSAPLRAARDSNSDGTPDHLSTDADGDGLEDALEAFDFDGDGSPDLTPAERDDNGDGWDDRLQADVPAAPDSDDDGSADFQSADDDGDGIPTAEELSGEDTDGDGRLNHLDADDDGDGIPTAEEGAKADSDGDGIPDYLDAVDDVEEEPERTKQTKTEEPPAETDESANGEAASTDGDPTSDAPTVPAAEGQAQDERADSEERPEDSDAEKKNGKESATEDEPDDAGTAGCSTLPSSSRTGSSLLLLVAAMTLAATRRRRRKRIDHG